MPVVYSPEGRMVSFHCNSVDEAKLIVKELKLRKKEQAAAKKEIAQQISVLRASHRNHIANIGPSPVARAPFGSFVRSMNQINRQQSRMNLENAIRPLENHKVAIDRYIAILDDALLKIESFLLKSTTPPAVVAQATPVASQIKICPNCHAHAELSAPVCASCGRVYKTKFIA